MYLAKKLVSFVEKANVKNVADFCVGDGELLRAAVNKWSNVECHGVDISIEVIEKVKIAHPNWNLKSFDFLVDELRNEFLKTTNKFELILLNPPFSCVGGSINKIEFEGEVFTVSTAMAFFVESIKHLDEDGSIYAILPNSVAYSNKDQKIRDRLYENFGFTILEESNQKHFDTCSPNVILVTASKKLKSSNLKIHNCKINRLCIPYSLFRGKVAMFTVKEMIPGELKLIHSTNLQNNQIEKLTLSNSNLLSMVEGPAILLPRVGMPNKKKICVIGEGERYILSDCVMAIKTDTTIDAINLMNEILEFWQPFEDLYKGTGAKYITIERLDGFLGSRNNVYDISLNEEIFIEAVKP